MELTELCKELNNWFEHKRHFGTFEIEDRKLKNDVGLKDGQYFRIVGSIFNDGVYRYPAFNLKDESFDGAVWAMAVPPEVIALLGKINDWYKRYGEAVSSPYVSESFGGYSYTKAGSSADGSSGNNAFSVFADDLNRWRKV